ncbi:hypothetical protein MRX96_055224 [Rhipicephalus microplus]
MDTTSTRKRSRPSESGSDDEGGSRKMHAVAPERATVACLTPTSNDAVAHEDAVTHATDEISQSEFQTVLSKSKKRRQRASTSQGPAAHTGPRPATESTAMLAHVAPGTSNAPTATQTAPAGVRATEHTMPASASSSLDSGTILFRPANASASFHRTSRLAIAQALCAARSQGGEMIKEKWQRNICHDPAFNFWRSIIPARHERKLPARNAYLADVNHHEKKAYRRNTADTNDEVLVIPTACFMAVRGRYIASLVEEEDDDSSVASPQFDDGGFLDSLDSVDGVAGRWAGIVISRRLSCCGG